MAAGRMGDAGQWDTCPIFDLDALALWRPAVRSRRALRCRSWRQQTVLRPAGAGGRARVLVAVQGHARTICGARRVSGAMIARNLIPTAWAALLTLKSNLTMRLRSAAFSFSGVRRPDDKRRRFKLSAVRYNARGRKKEPTCTSCLATISAGRLDAEGVPLIIH
jgi:hypothetical protein